MSDKELPKIVIVGAGAIGLSVGFLLEKSGSALVSYFAEDREIISNLNISFEGKNYTFNPKIWDEKLSPITFFVFCTKANHLLSAAKAVGNLNIQAPWLICCNGLEVLRDIQKSGTKFLQLYRALFNFGALFSEKKHLQIFGSPTLTVEQSTPSQQIWEISGFKLLISKSDQECEWQKLAMNLVVNPICTLLGSKNGIILDRPGLWELALELLGEYSAVAKQLNLDVPVDLPLIVKSGIERYAENRNSSLVDLENGRESELPWILGRFVEIAEREMVSVPVARTLMALCNAQISNKFEIR